MAIRSFNELPWYVQTLIVVAIIIGLDFAVYKNLLQDLRVQARNLNARIRDLEVMVSKQQAAQQKLTAFEREIQKDREKLDLLRAILPSEKETDEVVRRVQELASSSNLKIKKFVPQPVIPRGFYNDWPIKIDLDGSYANLSQFFEKIAQFTRIINVDDLSISALQGSDDPSHTLTASCVATTFVYQEQQTTAPLSPSAAR